MSPSLQITGNDIARTLIGVRQTVNKPRFLRDVLAIKKDRGDEDCAYFELNAHYYANRLNSTLEGAHYTASRVTANGEFGLREHEGKSYPTIRVNEIDFDTPKREERSESSQSRHAGQPDGQL